MQRYFMQLSYNGEKYHGWQIQPNQISVQEEIERALSTILRSTISIVGAGRTDTGVHASFYIAHFDFDSDGVKGGAFDTEALVFKLNRFLPPDIAIQSIYGVADNAHARFDATYRRYNYFMVTKKSPFMKPYAYQFLYPLDIELMNRACEMLYSCSDFASFAKSGADNKTTICDVRFAKWEVSGYTLKFIIEADRFLRNMVRAIVGTLIEVGQKRVSLERFQEIIETGSRSAAGSSVPGHALFLSDIGYPSEFSEGIISVPDAPCF